MYITNFVIIFNMNSRRPSDTESQIDDANFENKRSIPSFKRLTSIESTVSSIRLSLFDINVQPQNQRKYSFCSIEFLVKLIQLVSLLNFNIKREEI